MVREEDRDLPFFVIASLMLLVLAYYFIFSAKLTLSTLWVFINLSVGYIILTEEKMRARYISIMKGFGDKKAWSYAMLLLLLIFSAALSSIFLAAGGTSNENKGNPFVSNPILLASVAPLVPLFAYAETSLFQRGILKMVLRNDIYICPKCGLTAIGLERCDLCGTPLKRKRNISGLRAQIAIITSATVFAIAHVILTSSIAGSLTFIGGYLMAYVYLREGWLPVARIHAIYDYVLLCIIIGVRLL